MGASVSRELCTVSGTVLTDAGVKLEYISLTAAETLECSDLFVCTKCYKRLTRFEKTKKNVEGIRGRSAVFISPLKTIKQKIS